MNFIYKRTRFIFFAGIFTVFLISNHSCQTIDDLQSDYLLQKNLMDDLSIRVNSLTEEILQQRTITSSLGEQIAQYEDTLSQNSDLLQDTIDDVENLEDTLETLINDVNNIEDNLESISNYVGEMIEQSGDLSGDLNNLLNQVNQLDLIIQNLMAIINNLEANLHDHDSDDSDDDADADDSDDSDDDDDADADDSDDSDDDDDADDSDDDAEIIICSDCPQKISGYDIFIAGTSETEGAVYWVNGQKNSINVNSFATDITVDNSKVFVSGYTYGSTAKYWEINGQNIVQNDLPGFQGEAQSIVVKNNNVYVGGYYSHADGMSGAYSCYWKNGVKYNNSPRDGDHASFGIDVNSAGDVFLAGYYLNNHHYVLPAYWKNNQRSNLSRPNNQTDGEAVTVKIKPNGTTVYGGLLSLPHNFLGSVTKPAYWVGSQRTVCNIGQVPEWQNSGVHGMHLEGNTVYQAGWTMNMVGQYPTYWRNQTKHILQGATVNGIRYDQGKATDIAIVDGKVVVVGMLTGAPLLNANGVQYDYGDGPVFNNDTGFPCIWIDGTIHVLDTQGDFEVGGFFIK